MITEQLKGLIFAFLFFNLLYATLILKTDFLSSDFSFGLIVISVIYWLVMIGMWKKWKKKK